jgi:MtN3 and saliva related transmembrane protein
VTAYLIEALGYAAAALTTAAFAPQVAKSWRSGSVRDLSAGMLAAQGSGNALWCVYGVIVGSGPLAAANALTFALVATLFAMKLREPRPGVAAD